MFSRDEFIYQGTVEARPDDSRYRLAVLTGASDSVLDVGCAVGYIGRYLRQTPPRRWLAGIEIDAGAAETARPSYDQMIVGTIDDPAVWRQLQRPVGVMIFGDVLEHTTDPPKVLAMARDRLQDGGRIVVSIPNIAYAKIRLRLLRGHFDYEDWGIMDRTHLRFFTLRTARAMIEQAGFAIRQVEAIHSYPIPPELSGMTRRLFTVKRGLKSILARGWPALFAQQFILVADKLAPSRMPLAGTPA